MWAVLKSPMSLLQAYLRKPSTQRILNRRPGDKGFSLIELVVVVAVLAILAAIAIPSFTSLSDDARLNSSKSIIANMYKECEFNDARTGNGFHSVGVDGTPNGVTWGGDAIEDAQDGTGCDGVGYAAMNGPTSNSTCAVGMNFATGAQVYGVSTTGITITGWPQNLENCVAAEEEEEE